MIKIRLKANTYREVIKSVTDTPASVLTDAGVTYANAMVCLNGETLSHDELRMSFSELGIGDEQTISLSSVVKAQDGCR